MVSRRPALSVADVGIAMGAGTDIAIESADLVLTTNNLLGVVRAFDMSKKTLIEFCSTSSGPLSTMSGIPIAAGVFSGIGLVLNPELAGPAMAFSSVSVLTSSLLLNFSKNRLKRGLLAFIIKTVLKTFSNCTVIENEIF